MRVAIYARVSTDGQSVNAQLDELRDVAKRRGWTVAHEYTDAGVSGTKGRDQRPGLDALMNDAARGKFDYVAVWAIDRFGRSLAQVATNIDALKGLGVHVYADKQGMDSSTPWGKGMIEMAAVFAAIERDLILERTRAGIKRARKAGKVFGRPRVAKSVEAAIRDALAAGHGVKKTARLVGCGVSTVQRVKSESTVSHGPTRA